MIAAILFLTRLPVPTRAVYDANDVGRSARWFPLVGLLIGGIQAGLLFIRVFPPLVTAALIVAADALVTGALHLDGLADSADGFGGGRTREDVLRIMRDHAIGSYGGAALFLALLLKVVATAALIERQHALVWVLLAPVLGRWAIVMLSAALRYARESSTAVSSFIGRTEAAIATITALALACGLARWRGAIACVIVAVVAALWGWYCRHRIGGITGDTLGASVELSEIAVLLWGIVA